MPRNRWILTFGLCAFMAWQAPSVLAAGAEGSGWGWWETIGRWFNLAILFGLIIYAVRQPAKEFFANRKAEIQREMKEAEEARQAAERRLAEVEARLANLDTELEQLRAQAEQEAARERERILEAARREADKILAQAEREIGGLEQTVRKDLKQFAAHLAVQLAEDRVRSSMTDSDEARLVQKFFSDFASKAGGLSS